MAMLNLLDLVDDLHALVVTSSQAGATPNEVLAAELNTLVGSIVAYGDEDAQQHMLTFVLESLPGLVAQRQQVERWRLAARGCLES
jgi:hypothetical protein